MGQQASSGDYSRREAEKRARLFFATREPANELMETSCGRFDRIAELLLAKPPTNLEQCISHLRDDRVMMGITVQQMAFRPRSGEHLVRIP